ncbi:MAG: RAMP superfamily CRISPR-associated protein [Aeromicrobium sp.]|uniref:RAMP superfamily CRISPR-associated protein n=1 Tax=Aeromicrobium sp. TaxID=1871063 RepID=UPI0039E45DE0
MTVSIPFHFTFTSDWFVGSGTAQHGSIDRRVRRDVDGLPYLPGRTVKGMLRQAITEAAHALDDGKSDRSWSSLARQMLGRAGEPGLISVSSARLSPAVVADLRREPALRDATVVLRASTAIDVHGVADEDTLRLEERARQGAVVTATVELNVPETLWTDPDESWALRLLLHAASRLITRLGGKRRRGAGRCEVSADLGPQWNLSSAVERARTTPAPTLSPLTDTNEEDPSEPTAREGAWRRFRVEVTTRGPVILPDRSLGNVVAGKEHIPGVHLLRALTAACGRADVGAAVRDDALIVTDATPFADATDRGLPTPRCLRRAKTASAAPDVVVDILRQRFTTEDGSTIQGVTLGGYLHPDPAQVVTLENLPSTVAVTHVNVADMNVADGDQGGPFTYVAITPGSSFAAEIHVRDDAVDPRRLAGTHRLGASRSAEYGEVSIDVTPLDPAAPRDDLEKGDLLVAWLTSDVILPLGTTSASAFKATLERRLGVTLEVDPDATVWASASIVRRDGWHSGWGLPQPSVTGIGAGSVYRFRVAGTVPGEVLTTMEREGLGVRRAEGCGQIRFNPPCLTGEPRGRYDTRDAYQADQATEVTTGLTPEERRWLHAVHRAAIETMIDEQAIALVAQHDLRSKLAPRELGKAQAGIVRQIAEELTAPGGRRKAEAWSTKTLKAAVRKKAWPEGYIERLQTYFAKPTNLREANPLRKQARQLANDTTIDIPTLTVQRVLLAALSMPRSSDSSSVEPQGADA